MKVTQGRWLQPDRADAGAYNLFTKMPHRNSYVGMWFGCTMVRVRTFYEVRTSNYRDRLQYVVRSITERIVQTAQGCVQGPCGARETTCESELVEYNV